MNQKNRMVSEQPISRRRFLQGGVAVSVAAASDWRGASAQEALTGLGDQEGKRGPRVLVVVHLVGGNDGLNTVVPYGSRDYQRARPKIKIEERHVLKIRGSEALGLHPELGAVKELIEEGWGAIVQGVGYPEPKMSHPSSARVWHTGDPNAQASAQMGWVGMAMDAVTGREGTGQGLLSVCVGNSCPLALASWSVRPLVLAQPRRCGWAGGQLSSVLDRSYAQILETGLGAGGGPAEARGPAGRVAQAAADLRVFEPRIQELLGQRPVTAFPGGRLADKLVTVAAMIQLGWPTRVYWVELDGFDTHARQPDQHAQSLWELAVGVRGFCDELHAAGLGERVTTMVFSEFGRRVEENGSAGTDHGTAGPVFLFGPAVEPGLLGTHPSLSELADGDLMYTTDFRSVYAAVLDEWLGVDSTKVLGGTFKPAKIFKSLRG